MTGFPNNFIWGVATSAAQTEGAVHADGKGLSIWDAFGSISGNITDGSCPEDGGDGYRRYRDDIALLKKLGVNSYRFSVSWPRVLPEGKGAVNQAGLDYYKRLVDGLLANGIRPNMTLYHWDLPYALHRLGGWLSRDCIDWFADYARLIFKEFSDRVPMFATVNEPIATYVGYAEKVFAPGYGVRRYGRQACHNLLVAHGKAMQAFRAENRNGAQAGIVVDIWERMPLDGNDPADVAKAEYENENAHRAFLSPLLCGKYSAYLTAQTERDGTAPEIRQGDMETIAEPIDFFGLNSYGRIVVSADEKTDVQEAIRRNGGQYLSSGQEFYPQAVYESAKALREKYGLRVPIYITENGMGYYGEETLADGYRADYIRGFLREIARANADGYDIRGYYHWSLCDNWEWCAGLTPKFGLCTRNRTPKQSFAAYADIIKNNGF